jgi:hypothetical protein
MLMIGNWVPIESLAHSREQRLLFSSLDDAARAIRIRVYPATLDQLRVLLTNGCTALHFSGHGIAGHDGNDLLVFSSYSYHINSIGDNHYFQLACCCLCRYLRPKMLELISWTYQH